MVPPEHLAPLRRVDSVLGAEVLLLLENLLLIVVIVLSCYVLS